VSGVGSEPFQEFRVGVALSRRK
jgi:hypothetical protein